MKMKLFLVICSVSVYVSEGFCMLGSVSKSCFFNRSFAIATSQIGLTDKPLDKMLKGINREIGILRKTVESVDENGEEMTVMDYNSGMRVSRAYMAKAQRAISLNRLKDIADGYFSLVPAVADRIYCFLERYLPSRNPEFTEEAFKVSIQELEKDLPGALKIK